ncbi:hypothetical protein Taro_037323 [Colocasia esculenta]|uniref:Uncharacterized protein n=1 Tax=Colocasia esculenta TaxID=4460 RepID=A0A843WFX1_COLES|nr:hypothetical protein [Colocasia esculenta]
MPLGGRPARGRGGSRFLQGHRLPPTTTAPSTSGLRFVQGHRLPPTTTALFTLCSGASPSSSYHGSFHQRFTLCYGAPPSPSCGTMMFTCLISMACGSHLHPNFPSTASTMALATHTFTSRTSSMSLHLTSMTVT